MRLVTNQPTQGIVGKESTSVQTETTVPKFSNRTSQRMQTAAVRTDTHTEDACPGGRAAAHVSLTGALTSLLRREDRPHRHTASRLQEFTPKCGAVGGCIVTPHPKQTQDTGRRWGSSGLTAGLTSLLRPREMRPRPRETWPRPWETRPRPRET